MATRLWHAKTLNLKKIFDTESIVHQVAQLIKKKCVRPLGGPRNWLCMQGPPFLNLPL